MNSNVFRTNTSRAKIFIAILFATTVAGGASGCGKSFNSKDGEWASGVPDEPGKSGEPTPTPTPPPVSSPTPLPSPTPQSTPQATPVPVDDVVFAMSAQSFQLAHGPAQKWDGCDARALAKGGYGSDTACGSTYLHPAFAAHLNRHFYYCVEKAAVTAGFRKPARVFIKHFGSYNDRNARGSNSLSLHAYARALDVVNINLFDDRGLLTRFSTNVSAYSGANAVYYDAFRDCWRETMPAACTPSRSEYKGSIGHPKSKLGGNDLHNDHIHLSYPLCAG